MLTTSANNKNLNRSKTYAFLNYFYAFVAQVRVHKKYADIIGFALFSAQIVTFLLN